VLAFLRRDGERCVLLVANFTPVPRPAHRVGVPAPGLYEVRLNTDASQYGGANTGNAVATAEAVHCHGHAWSVVLDLPALGALVLMPCIA
jgi:1,4-alpha-glucan branching enzyme